MKTLTMTAALALGLAAAAPAQAQDALQAEYCAALAEVAGATMELRQIGAPLELGLDMAQTAHPMIRPQALQLVARAWQSDIVHPSQQVDAMLVFAARAYDGCMRTQF